MRFNKLNEYYKSVFGERVLKICLDGGFSCPNRDGQCGFGGCTFCSENRSGDLILHKDINTQIECFLNGYRGERANKFVAYFQSGTNTYAPVCVLKQTFDKVLKYNQIVALSVATRPDCITEEVIMLLKTYQNKVKVFVELGLQTHEDSIAENFNRGYKTKVFEDAVLLLNKHNIDVVVHTMVGLPKQSKQSCINTVLFLNNLHISGIKICPTCVLKNTKLQQEYLSGNYQPLCFEEYMQTLTQMVAHLNKNVVLHRFTCDPPKELFVAPEFCGNKKLVLNALEKYMQKQYLCQGCLVE